MKFKKKKILIILCTITALMGMQTVAVNAAGINGNEAGIIGAASGTFTYNGSPYVATQGSISALTSYLSGDGIDLTASQANRAISLMYSNVREGVEGGYLTYAGSGPAPDVYNPDFYAEEDENLDLGDDFGEGSVDYPGKVTVYSGESIVKVTNAKGGAVYTAETPVKNTGFSLKGGLVAVIIMGIILAGCAVVIARFKLLANEK